VATAYQNILQLSNNSFLFFNEDFSCNHPVHELKLGA